MKLSRAISLASRWMQGHVVTLRDGEAREYHKLCHEALTLMREQEERSKGCEYCSDPSPHRDCIIGNVEQMLVGRSFADAYVSERRIKFCPMCGRSLEEV